MDWALLATAAPAVRTAKSSTDAGLSTADWAAIASAGFAAVAAIAALITVLQNRKVISATLRPRLTGVVVQAVQPDPVLQVHNTGGAVAIAVRGIWASGGQRSEGDVGPGIGSGENAVIVASLPREGLGDSHGVMVYADALRNYYADSLDGHHWVWRNRWWKRKFSQPSLLDLYARFYGESIADLPIVEWRIAHRSTAAGVSPSGDARGCPPGDSQVQIHSRLTRAGMTRMCQVRGVPVSNAG